MREWARRRGEVDRKEGYGREEERTDTTREEHKNIWKKSQRLRNNSTKAKVWLKTRSNANACYASVMMFCSPRGLHAAYFTCLASTLDPCLFLKHVCSLFRCAFYSCGVATMTLGKERESCAYTRILSQQACTTIKSCCYFQGFLKHKS